MDPTLAAYWDESGQQDDPACSFLGLIGLIAPSDRWDNFMVAWNTVLMEFGIDHFHASHCEHNRGLFRSKTDWTSVRKQELYVRLLSVLAEIRPRIVGAVLDLAAWRALSDDDRSHFHSGWMACFQESLRLAANVAGVVNSDLEVTVSTQNEFSDVARQLWDLIIRRTDFGYARLKSFAMVDMKTKPPLQAADLVVYELVKGLPHYLLEHDLRPAFPTLLLIDPHMWLSQLDAPLLEGQLRGFKVGLERMRATDAKRHPRA